MNDLPRIYADFNNADGAGRLRLNVAGSQGDLARLGEVLEPGLRVIFYSEDLEVEGWVERSEFERDVLVGRIEWSQVLDSRSGLDDG